MSAVAIEPPDPPPATAPVDRVVLERLAGIEFSGVGDVELARTNAFAVAAKQAEVQRAREGTSDPQKDRELIKSIDDLISFIAPAGAGPGVAAGIGTKSSVRTAAGISR